jgi:hypothetical protein
MKRAIDAAAQIRTITVTAASAYEAQDLIANVYGKENMLFYPRPVR